MTAATLAPAGTWRWPPVPVHLAAPLALLLVLVSLGPSTFMGGSADDYRYLQGVRCLAEQGYCVPRNHWEARLPLTLPTAWLAALFGESRFTLGLVPLGYAAGTLILLATLVRRYWGERAALIAGLVLASTPIFVRRSVQLNVDIPELFFLLAATVLLLEAVGRDRTGWALAAGALFGLAVLSRTTAVAAAPIVAAGLFLFSRSPWRWCACLAVGAAATLGTEALIHAIGAGDPLLSWRLAHAHTAIPSTALPAGFDLSRSPILNPDYIAAWARPAGVEVHWVVDGGLNVLLEPLARIPLLAGSLLGLSLLVARRSPLGFYLAGSAAAYFALLTYVLAIHPSARMFMPILCLAAGAVGVWATRNRGIVGQAAVAALMLGMMAQGTTYAVQTLDPAPYEAEAERWAMTRPGGLAVDRTTAHVFATSTVIAALPLSSRAAAEGLPVLSLNRPCLHRPGAAAPTLLRSWSPRPSSGLPGTVRRLLGVNRPRLQLCILAS